MGPDGPMLWGLVDTGWYGVDLVRAKDASFHGLPAIRIDETEQAPGLARSAEFLGWWTRRYAAILSTSWRTPFAAGRNFLLASMESVASAPPGLSIHEWHRRKWQHIRLGPDCLDDLLAQRDHFELS